MEQRDLLLSLTKKDFEITYFSGSGAGGQHRNKHKNCVRIKHKETGITAVGQDQKSLEQNKKKAFERLTNNEDFRNWIRIKTSEAVLKEKGEKSVQELIQEMVQPIHLKIEIKDEEGNWFPSPEPSHPK